MSGYLMLEKDDITKVGGVITRKKVMEELRITQSQFYTFINRNKPFRGKYILIEMEFEDEKE